MAATLSDPLVKTVTVPCAPDRAFTLFTDEIASWWPLESHSVGEESATGLELQGHPGGHIVETVADGGRHVWGTVTDWEPPRRVAFTWHPGRTPEAATRVEVSFAAEGEGTRVTLVHSEWARRADGPEVRGSYDAGWTAVLSRLVAAVPLGAGEPS